MTEHSRTLILKIRTNMKDINLGITELTCCHYIYSSYSICEKDLQTKQTVEDIKFVTVFNQDATHLRQLKT